MRVRCGRRTEEQVIVETLQRLQGQSEASSSFGSSVWSLSQLQNHLDSDKEGKSSVLASYCMFIPTVRFVFKQPNWLHPNNQLPPQDGAAAGQGRTLFHGRKFAFWNAQGSSGGGLGSCTKAREKNVHYMMWHITTKTNQSVETGACHTDLNFLQQCDYTFVITSVISKASEGLKLKGISYGKLLTFLSMLQWSDSGGTGNWGDF